MFKTESCKKMQSCLIVVLMCTFIRATFACSHAVAFSARLGKGDKVFAKSSGIPFEMVTTNIGNHYNPKQGLFIAPVSGLYFFTGSVVTTQEFWACFTIVKYSTDNHGKTVSEWIARPFSSKGIFFQSGTDSAFVHLIKGDRVQATTDCAVRYLPVKYDKFSKFTGALIKADYHY